MQQTQLRSILHETTYLYNYRRRRLGSNLVRIGSEKPLLQGEDHSGKDPQLVPGFLYLSFGMCRERIPSEPELVGSEEIHQA